MASTQVAPDASKPETPSVSPASGEDPVLELFIKRADTVRARIQRIERLADDLALLAAVDAGRAHKGSDSAWGSSSAQPMSLGFREVMIFSGLLALGIGAAFFIGYMASRMAPNWLELR